MTQAQTSRFIPASPEAVYRACTNPEALAAWRVPDGMKAQIHAFDAGVGGGYRMSLFYLGPEAGGRGKTTAREELYRALSRAHAADPGVRVLNWLERRHGCP